MASTAISDITPQRSARLKAGLSLAEADAITGIGFARLSVLERLPPERLTPGVRARLCAAYGVTVEELTGTPAPTSRAPKRPAERAR